MRHLFLIPTLALAVVAFAPSASAQLSARDEASARFETGVKYYDARDFESARLAFAQAYAVLQTPKVLLNLARSELYASHPVEALAHLDQLMADPNLAADKRPDAKRLRDEAFKKTGHIAVKTSPEAEIRLDGRAVMAPGLTPLHVTAGSHAVEVRLPGTAKTKAANVDAKAGEVTSVDLTFDKDEPRHVHADPPPRLALSGADPVTEPPPPVAEGSFWGLRSIGGLALIGAGAVTLGVGVGFKIDQGTQSSRVSTLDARIPREGCDGSGSATPDCRDLATAQATRNQDKTSGGTLLVLGAVGVGAGAALVATAALWPHRQQTSGLRIVPVTGPRQAGLILSSSF